jgi:dCTP deaminase
MNCLLSHNELLELLKQGVLVGGDPDLVNSASIDIRLGPKILVEGKSCAVSLAGKEAPDFVEVDISQYAHRIPPGGFILAHSVEVFNLPPSISAEYKLKSSMARIGLDHLNAGWCDAGWHGSVLTLELKNVSQGTYIDVKAGDKIGQMIFFRHAEVPADRSYAVRGRYNRNSDVSSVRQDPRRVYVIGEDDLEDESEPVVLDLNSPAEDERYDEVNKD